VTLPEVGAPAPPFSLPTATGREVSLADYRGVSRVVLWFSKGLF
jgi:peroxiredoxin